jgi:2-haloacid dehalogenase
VTALARSLYPEKGEALAAQWSAKLFGYTWLATSAGRYQDFATLADAALRFSAASLGIPLGDAEREQLVAQYSRLDAWPDVKPALERLRAAGTRLAFCANLGEAMLTANMRNAGIAAFFEPPLSTDRVRQFKPAPAAYQMALHAFGLPREAIGFAAFGGWDAAGAGWFGFRTAWINRLGVPAETIGPQPEIVSTTMDGVLALAGLV